jgi:predicted RNase H-like nuclease (RuvC/YqgF family)
LGRVNKKLSRLYSALETGKVDIEDLAPRIKELRNQQNELEDKRNELLDSMNDESPKLLDLKTVKEYVSGLKTLLSSSSIMEQKSFLRSFIKRVELNAPEVIIDYTMPLPTEELTTTQEVLRIDKIGSPSRTQTNNLVVNSHYKKVSYITRLNIKCKTSDEKEAFLSLM